MFMFTLQTDRFLPSRETTSSLIFLIIVSFFLSDPILVVALCSSYALALFAILFARLFFL